MNEDTTNKNLDMFLGASPLIFARAKALRRSMTPSEKLLWQELKGKKLEGFKFRRQHPIMTYILDFYCHELRLGIELDGKVHDNIQQKNYDESRTAALSMFGIRILRFSNHEVQNDLESVLQRIVSASHTSQPPEGGAAAREV